MKAKIVEINIDEKNKWNEIVRSFTDYEVFYLNEYVSAFMKETPKNGIPVMLFYENGQDTAINVVFKRDIALDPKMSGRIAEGQYYDLITPYGYGGFWGSITDWGDLNDSYSKYCLENHYICEFVRFELFSEYFLHYPGEVETRTHNIVRSLDISLDDMWMDFKQKVRKNVKKASSYNLSVIMENTGEYLDDFLRIYYSTMERTEAENEFFFSKRFFDDLNTMKDNVMYFHVVYEGKIVSTELVLYGAENCYSYLGGTDRDYFEVRPNDYLKYEIIKWAKEKGLKRFVLGGGYGADDGIYNYKLCLAPHGVYDFYIGRRVFDSEAYSHLVSIRAEENPECRESEYFPKYRV